MLDFRFFLLSLFYIFVYQITKKLTHPDEICPHSSRMIERLLAQIYHVSKSAGRPVSNRLLILKSCRCCVQMNIQGMILFTFQTDPFVQYFYRIVDVIVTAYPKINEK